MRRQRLGSTGFAHKTLAQIRALLESQGMDAETVEKKVNEIKHHRAELRGLKVKQHRSVTYWRYLRTPLKREIDIARSSMEYLRRKNARGEDMDDTDHARREAYEAYLLVLTNLLMKFDEFIELNPNMTPTQVLRQEQEAGKWRFVTMGEHWADWVPPKAKAPLVEMFAAIPHRVRAKTKIPFERKIPKGSQRSRRTVLEEAMSKELATLLAKHEAYAPNDTMSEAMRDEMLTQQSKLRAKMQQIKKAQRILHEKRDNQPFPLTWHGLLVNEEKANG